MTPEFRLKAVKALTASVRYAKVHLYFRLARLYLLKFFFEAAGLLYKFVHNFYCGLAYAIRWCHGRIP